MKRPAWTYLLPFPLIPILCVWLCRILRLAQGEKEEEIAFGLLAGLLLDLIYGAVLLHRANHADK